MKLFIMTDLEGASGVTGAKDELDPRNGRKFGEAIANLTHDVNAAIEGALEAGAEQITVLDGDGRKYTVLRDKLHPKARLYQGARGGELAGLDRSYEAMFVIGAHAMAGTAKGVLNHTFSSQWIQNLWLNGRLIGEIGVWAAWAAEVGLPTVLVTGDRAAVDEAKAFIPEVETVSVKEGLGRYYALCLSAEEVARDIRAAARKALQRRGEIALYRPGPPYEMQVEYHDSQLADAPAGRPGVTRIDGRTVKATADTVNGAMSLVWP